MGDEITSRAMRLYDAAARAGHLAAAARAGAMQTGAYRLGLCYGEAKGAWANTADAVEPGVAALRRGDGGRGRCVRRDERGPGTPSTRRPTRRRHT